MIQITNKADCCGCTACMSICTHRAITMKPDALGFLYPEINTDKCTNCGLCEKVCSFNSNYNKHLDFNKPIAYGARHKNMSEVETSRSGAAFIAISDCILDQGGVVYGVGYEDHFRVVHKRAVNKEQRNEFKGSKYVQSDLGYIFLQVKNDLKDGKVVLFSGTPCQISGLSSYIGKKLAQNLYLVDIVCHGVPSPYIWRDYIAYYEKKYNRKIISVNFRDKKEYGWHDHKETFTFDNGRKITPPYSPFTDLFFKNIILRQSCGKCYFCNTTRPGDITIADFWGWEKNNSKLNADDKGLSLLLINSRKGLTLFQSANNKLYTFHAQIENCLQPNLKYPTVLNSQSQDFEELYKKYGFKYVLKKFTNIGIKNRIRIYIIKIKNRISHCQ